MPGHSISQTIRMARVRIDRRITETDVIARQAFRSASISMAPSEPSGLDTKSFIVKGRRESRSPTGLIRACVGGKRRL